MKNGYAFGPGNPHRLSQMRTELVWEGTFLYSRFRSEMIGRDQGENEVRRLLVPPTTLPSEIIRKVNDYRSKFA